MGHARRERGLASAQNDALSQAAWKAGHHGYWDTGHLLSTYSGTGESVDAIWARPACHGTTQLAMARHTTS